MSARYYFALLRRSILKKASEHKSLSREKLRKIGAKSLADHLTRTPEISKRAFIDSSFTWGTRLHVISSSAQGISYLINGAKHGTIEDTAIESAKNLTRKEREHLFGNLDAEVKTTKTWAEKETEREDEKKFLEGKNIVFTRFIEGVMKNIPAKTTASGLIGDSWKNIAYNAALSLVNKPEDLDIVDDAEDGSTVLSFLGDDDAEHKFVVIPTGFIYMIGEEKVSYKGRAEIIKDFLQKRND